MTVSEKTEQTKSLLDLVKKKEQLRAQEQSKKMEEIFKQQTKALHEHLGASSKKENSSLEDIDWVCCCSEHF